LFFEKERKSKSLASGSRGFGKVFSKTTELLSVSTRRLFGFIRSYEVVFFCSSSISASVIALMLSSCDGHSCRSTFGLDWKIEETGGEICIGEVIA